LVLKTGGFPATGGGFLSGVFNAGVSPFSLGDVGSGLNLPGTGLPGVGFNFTSGKNCFAIGLAVGSLSAIFSTGFSFLVFSLCLSSSIPAPGIPGKPTPIGFRGVI